MIAIESLIEQSLATSPRQEGVTVINLYFVDVVVKKDAPRDLFIQFTKERIAEGNGVFLDMGLEALKRGPSYIDIGAWLGDQSYALIYMALGLHHGAWNIVSPETLGMSDEVGGEMAGRGLLLISGVNEAFEQELL